MTQLPAAAQPVTLQALIGDPTAEWRRPAIVPEQLRAAAAAALTRFAERYAPAGRDRKLEFLIKLGIVCAGTLTPADAKAKAELLADLLDHPACCFADVALKRIAPQFKFFPGIGELAPALDAELHRQRTIETRLRALAGPNPALEPPKPTGKRWAEMTPEEQAAHKARMDQWRAELAASPDPLRDGPTTAGAALRRAYSTVAASTAARQQQGERTECPPPAAAD